MAGPDKNAYFHESFLRGRRSLCHMARRVKVKNQGARKPYSPNTEPNFYTMVYCLPNNGKKKKGKHRTKVSVVPVAIVIPVLLLPPPPRHCNWQKQPRPLLSLWLVATPPLRASWPRIGLFLT